MESVSDSLGLAGFGECPHDTVTVEGNCERCGLCMGGSANATHIELSGTHGEGYCHSTVSITPSFAGDLRALDIPDDVRGAALTLATSNVSEVHRMGVRRQLLFVYVYLAYLQLGKPLKPEELAAKIKIAGADLSQALRLVSGTSASRVSLPRVNENVITAPIVVISPTQYISSLCIEYGLAEHVQAINDHAEAILKMDRRRQLLARKPNHVAIALIRHYLNTNSMKPPANFAKGGISPTILKQRLQEVNDVVGSACVSTR